MKTDQVAMVMMVMVVMVVMMMAMVAIWFIVVMVIKLNIIMIFEKTDHQSRARPRHRRGCQRGSLRLYQVDQNLCPNWILSDRFTL